MRKVTCLCITKLTPDLGFINRIAPIMALTIGDVGLELSTRPAVCCGSIGKALCQGRILGKGCVNGMADLLYHCDIGKFLAAADIVGLPNPALGKDQLDSQAMILNVEPIPHVQAIAVYR